MRGVAWCGRDHGLARFTRAKPRRTDMRTTCVIFAAAFGLGFVACGTEHVTIQAHQGPGDTPAADDPAADPSATDPGVKPKDPTDPETPPSPLVTGLRIT